MPTPVINTKGGQVGDKEKERLSEDEKLKAVGKRDKRDEPDVEAHLLEAGMKDTGVKDAGVKDAGVKDAGVKDAGLKDYGLKDID
jgi:hypothetical protein